ncbi:MAG: hypothetical protein F4090_02560 [Nitrospira sp. SB0672_bin_25]|nr:hypothetical protein [Nitrospira sp. SB0672_bin_25]
MSAVERKTMARVALREIDSPVCPFQVGTPTCSKRGGVCSIREGDNLPVIVCPRRFNAGNLLPRWLAEIAGFPEVHLASEDPFMRSPTTDRAAGRVDLVIAGNGDASAWYGLEIQDVYFSGQGMDADFRAILNHDGEEPPEPTASDGRIGDRQAPSVLVPQLLDTITSHRFLEIPKKFS